MKKYLQVIESVYSILGNQSPKIVISSSRTTMFVYVKSVDRVDMDQLLAVTDLRSIYPDDDSFLCLQINIEEDEDEES